LSENRRADEHRLEFRIGINLGDVIVEGDDIEGDGVNIDERLQSLAEPGGMVISGTAYDHVEKHLDVGFIFLGEQRMIAAYCVIFDSIIDQVRATGRRRLVEFLKLPRLLSRSAYVKQPSGYTPKRRRSQ